MDLEKFKMIIEMEIPKDGESIGGNYENLVEVLRARLNMAESIKDYVIDYKNLRDEEISQNHKFPCIEYIDMILDIVGEDLK